MESKNLDSRLYLYKYDSVANFQRRAVYQWRDQLLENQKGFEEFLDSSLRDCLRNILELKQPVLIVKEFNVAPSLTELSFNHS